MLRLIQELTEGDRYGISKQSDFGRQSRHEIPKSRYLPSGGAVCNISASPPRTSGKTKAASSRSTPSGTALSFVRRLAEICGEYLKKGSQVYVEGRLQTRKWQDKEGHERYTTEIVADRMQMLGSRAGASATRVAWRAQGRGGSRRPAAASRRRRRAAGHRLTIWTTTFRSEKRATIFGS